MLLLALVASADVIILPEGIAGELLQHASLYSTESLPLGLCLRVLQASLRNGLFSLLGVATVALFFAADALPLSLFFDGCFAVVATRADFAADVASGSPLLQMLLSTCWGPTPVDPLTHRLWRMLCRRVAQTDTLPPFLFSVDALPPRLHLLCW